MLDTDGDIGGTPRVGRVKSDTAVLLTLQQDCVEHGEAVGELLVVGAILLLTTFL